MKIEELSLVNYEYGISLITLVLDITRRKEDTEETEDPHQVE
jgi:hypothetical protein